MALMLCLYHCDVPAFDKVDNSLRNSIVATLTNKVHEGDFAVVGETAYSRWSLLLQIAARVSLLGLQEVCLTSYIHWVVRADRSVGDETINRSAPTATLSNDAILRLERKMCYAITPYYTLCGCYRTSTLVGGRCIRATSQRVLGFGCWDTVDLGVQMSEGLCKECLKCSKHGRSGSADSGYGSMHSRTVSQVSMESRTAPEAARPTLHATTATIDPHTYLDIPELEQHHPQHNDEQARKDSAVSFGTSTAVFTSTVATTETSSTTVSPYSSTTSTKSISSNHRSTADCARSLLACLPSSIPRIARNESGVGVGSWVNSDGVPIEAKDSTQRQDQDQLPPPANMHWRGFDNRG